MGVYEMLRIVPSIQKLIEEGATATAILAQAKREGMRTMIDDGVEKVLSGLTTVEEVAGLVASHDQTVERRASA
jgi:type II secretory ATPase GspE/PulE/Tfp pilus assembly ATPase PilB-like protein